MRTTYKTIQSIISKNFSGVEFERTKNKTLIASFESDSIKIILVDGNSYESEMGIHLTKLTTKDDLAHHLTDAVETALKDGFSTIWVHQQRKASEERRAYRLEALKSWSKAKSNALAYSLNKLDVDAESVMDGLTEEQIDVVLALVSGNSARASDESRAYWAPKYRALQSRLRELGEDSHKIIEAYQDNDKTA